MSRGRMFNVRLDDDLFDDVVDAAKAEGLDRSTWTREILGAVVYGKVTLDDLRTLVEQRTAQTEPAPEPSPQGFSPVGRVRRVQPATRRLAVQGVVRQQVRTSGERKCLHPEASIRRLPMSRLCLACGEVNP